MNYKGRVNNHTELLKIGDKITTDFFDDEENIVRTILSLKNNVNTGSGRGVIFDGGELCKCCGKLAGTPLERFPTIFGYIDAAWAISFNSINNKGQ